ncbi:DUF4382 domain-containing protein [Geobacter sp. AOG2]|uniref:DUF4382 domain-containing protein n=1 Tax=Geobacter sp. AOG2 TaxID=1566347 RepID=UPI001CC7CC62|nr:DUF4382 domain-containing protein [Geobacter sp. AOG2]GFE62745.1 lipoprotein [Geobacter sp. AOG2]
MRKNIRLVIAGLPLIVLAALALGQLPGCGGGGSGSGTSSTGTLRVAITDSPAFLTYSSVHIKVDKIAVVPAGKEGFADTDPGLPVIADFTASGGQDVNILKLHFLQQLLGSAVIPAGTYSQVRLILHANPSTAPYNNYLILASSSGQIALTTPSAQQTGVKIVGRFTVAAGVLNTIMLEFNPDTAIVRAGNSGQYNLKPTGIHIQQIMGDLNTATGSISGMVRSPGFATWSSARVSIVPRSPAATAIVTGDIFSNYSSPGVWKAPFIAYVPPNSSMLMPSASYKVFVSVTGPAGKFLNYSSQALTVSANTDTSVSPDGVAGLELAP